MHNSHNLPTSVTALLGVGLLFAIGCSAVDPADGDDTAASDTVATETEDLGTGSEALASSGQPPSCSICAITQSCCESIGAGSMCTFSADTCYSLDPLRQYYHARNCRMFLRTMISAQSINNRSAPNACFLP
jgi:hypothetical protein